MVDDVVVVVLNFFVGCGIGGFCAAVHSGQTLGAQRTDFSYSYIFLHASKNT